MNFLRLATLLTVTIFIFLAPLLVLGQGGVFEFKKPLNSQNIIQLTERIAGWLALFAIVLAVAMAVIAGIMYALAGGNTEAVQKATRALLWTLAGLAVILLARGIVEIIKNALGVEFVPREKSFLPNLTIAMTMTAAVLRDKFDIQKDSQDK